MRTITSEIHVVRGDLDDPMSATAASMLPEQKVITLGSWRFGLCHGHQVYYYSVAVSLEDFYSYTI